MPGEIIEHVRSDQGNLAIVRLGKRHFGVGVDEGLLVNPPNSLQSTHDLPPACTPTDPLLFLHPPAWAPGELDSTTPGTICQQGHSGAPFPDQITEEGLRLLGPEFDEMGKKLDTYVMG